MIPEYIMSIGLALYIFSTAILFLVFHLSEAGASYGFVISTKCTFFAFFGPDAM
jgi:hypothetical protein